MARSTSTGAKRSITFTEGPEPCMSALELPWIVEPNPGPTGAAAGFVEFVDPEDPAGDYLLAGNSNVAEGYIAERQEVPLHRDRQTRQHRLPKALGANQVRNILVPLLLAFILLALAVVDRAIRTKRTSTPMPCCCPEGGLK